MFPLPGIVDFRSFIREEQRGNRSSALELLNDQKPPVTLFINHESREETLKHYTIFLRPLRDEDGLKMNPLCFDEKRDTAAIHFRLFTAMGAPRNLCN